MSIGLSVNPRRYLGPFGNLFPDFKVNLEKNKSIRFDPIGSLTGSSMVYELITKTP